MKTKYLLFSALAVSFAIAAYCATNKISRTGQNIMLVVGGTTTTNGKGVIVSENTNTNEYSIVSVTATVAGSATAYTNTFATAYLATPTIWHGEKSGTSIASSGYGTVTPTITTTSFIVTGLNSSGATNDLPFLIYGYKRTGNFE